MRLGLLLISCHLASASTLALAQDSSDAGAERPPTIAEKTSGLVGQEGLLDLFLDHENGVVYLEAPAPNPSSGEVLTCIYVESLRGGLGANAIGLDRGQLGPSRLVTLRVLGGKMLLEQQNLAFRATSESADERRAVRDSFATSVLWSGPIVARDPDGRVLVDATSLIVRDSHRIARRLDQTGQGSFSLDADRSGADTHACLAFPDNVELGGLLTFSADDPGAHVRATAPDPTSITLTTLHSLVRLPDDGYTPRDFDPRVACFHVRFQDYAAPLEGSIETRWIRRHRLRKASPNSLISEPIRPIVYYVDRGAPERIKQALVEGASWWSEAFEAAGFKDAFRVEEMPEGAHPLDVRYNVIQWVHRSTRGWSYGGSIVDPRTGEIIKGHVTLGSLRVRQDRRIFEGLAGTAHTGSGESDDPVELALARIRQLSAHEVGHTLGFAHNFAASTYGRASVMDYPAPLVQLRSAQLDFSEAYAVGVGKWDIHCVRYAYSQFASGLDEAAELEQIIQEARRAGYLFMSDADARPRGAAHPKAHLWDNGANAVDELGRLIELRRFAIEQFGRDRVMPGTPIDRLHETFVPVYLLHRYQLAAAAKLLGGFSYEYEVAGVNQTGPIAVDPDEQRRALGELLQTIEPGFLDIPDHTLDVLVPRAFGSRASRERMGANTAPAFDALGAASIAASLTIEQLLEPNRCARLIEQHRRDATQLSAENVLSAMSEQVFGAEPSDSVRLGGIRHRVGFVLVDALIALAQDASASPEVRSLANHELQAIHGRMNGTSENGSRVAYRQLSMIIERHLDRPFDRPPPTDSSIGIPPGDPIGAGADWLADCSIGG